MSDLNIDIKGVRSLNASISPLISRLSGVERQLNMHTRELIIFP